MQYSKEELRIQMTMIRDHFDSWATAEPKQMKELLDDILEADIDLKEVEQFFNENQEFADFEQEQEEEDEEQQFIY